jgi:hypothetical protein
VCEPISSSGQLPTGGRARQRRPMRLRPLAIVPVSCHSVWSICRREVGVDRRPRIVGVLEDVASDHGFMVGGLDSFGAPLLRLGQAGSLAFLR